MQKHSDVVLDRSGSCVVGAEVTVLTYPGGATATIYSDNGVTPTANPIVTDNDGRFEFYAADGRYSLQVVYGTNTITLTDVVLLEDPVDASTLYATTITTGSTTALSLATSGGTQAQITNTASSNRYITLTGSNGGNPAIGVSGGNLQITGQCTFYSGANDFVNVLSDSGAMEICRNAGDAYIDLKNLAAEDYDVRLQSVGTSGEFAVATGGGGIQFKVTNTASSTRWITVTGSNGGNPTIGVSGGNLAITPNVVFSGAIYPSVNTATPAGGDNTTGIRLGSSQIGIFWGSGAPTLSAPQGSIYLRTDGGASTRIYSNNNGTTGWSAITSA